MAQPFIDRFMYILDNLDGFLEPNELPYIAEGNWPQMKKVHLKNN